MWGAIPTQPIIVMGECGSMALSSHITREDSYLDFSVKPPEITKAHARSSLTNRLLTYDLWVEAGISHI